MPGFEPAVLRRRLLTAGREAAGRGIDALLITPSPDYAYLLGYHAPALERLTCLVVRAGDDPVLVLPALEAPLARHALGPLADAIELVPWGETDDPFQLVRAVLDTHIVRVGVQDQMWARFVLRLQAVLDPVQLVPAGPTLAALRRVKSATEIARLRAAAAAADEAMDAIRAQRLSGRTEAEVSAEIRELLLEAGHDTADFAIVGSGPNSASPHHEAGERVIATGDAVVLDIGGTRAGYCSDTTRTVFVGEVDPEFAKLHAVLRAAQAAACDAVRPGITARELDAVARDIITEAGYGAAFMHRTGHGIGMETHEEPYIVSSGEQALVAGEAFSIEPGIYIEDTWGARIEDIVICTPDGGERLNTTSTELLVVG
jgi:Xaa-Pro aminopeptidase